MVKKKSKKELKKEAERKKKNDELVLQSLMGLLESLAAIFLGAQQMEDEVMSALLVKIHLFELLMYHKEVIKGLKVETPEFTEVYQEYIKNWNDVITGKEKDFKEYVERYIKKVEPKIDYII